MARAEAGIRCAVEYVDRQIHLGCSCGIGYGHRKAAKYRYGNINRCAVRDRAVVASAAEILQTVGIRPETVVAFRQVEES